ncbi:DeoR/GlpR transcriptional regulator [Lactiplantibacillus pentosus]|uniref:DeoR/GlpR family DNA-binding transcription regulator n=1 Tax=Lactiplantibacillus pentosus TaxID=1589 RepID=UPI000EA9C3D6|nr:DeoR/GlpR family DNA-binding transcription regulator [Lactiplantibacillus pentosus]AYG38772.1 DeoR/GlpR transcriptional regulator [Lactiplantibacillus pentosus]AYG41432.1 DeoR/GlpR transcriptional regulator [Lactiplantibacillus pentosus]MCJ8181019.1 DeoR/GlpR family DNA-binding transcription regulator [Lactiplantibacillus pentosus]
MYKNDRLNLILDILQKHKKISMRDLSQQTYSSPSTLRRDLIELEKDHQIVRSFGQIEIVKSKNIEFSFPFRKQENEQSKKHIADIASNFIGDNMALFLDSSSTVATLLPYIAMHQNLVIITNGLFLGMKLNQYPNIKTFMAGGRLRPGSGSFLGEYANNYLDNFKADLAFFSCTALDSSGIYMASEEQSNVKRHMIDDAHTAILLCDSSKFGHTNYYKLSDYACIQTIITDQAPQPTIENAIKSYNIEILY